MKIKNSSEKLMLRFQTYPKYKDSGVEWLGEVPQGWEPMRLKLLLKEPLKYGANEVAELIDQNLPRYIRITDIQDDGSLRDDTFRSIPDEIASQYLLQEGDLLFARSGATVGKTFRYNRSWGIAAYAGYLIRARFDNSKIDSQFIYYFAQSKIYWDWLKSTFIQATIQNVSAERYSNLIIPIPTIREQQSITLFLDQETSRIDKLIEKKEKLIELLQQKRTALITHAVTKGLDPEAPMKDSGVEWLGKIPKDWEVKRIKNLGQIRYGLGEPPRLKEDGLLFVRATDIYRGKIKIDAMQRVDPDDIPWARDPVLQTGDIIVVRSGAYTGDSAIIPSELSGGIVGYDLVLRVKTNSSGFIAYALLSKYLLHGQIYLQKLRAAQPHLNAEDLGGCIVFLPPYSEQCKIVFYLDLETKRIDELINAIEKSLILYREYRTALISAAVTGKIDVRGGGGR